MAFLGDVFRLVFVVACHALTQTHLDVRVRIELQIPQSAAYHMLPRIKQNADAVNLWLEAYASDSNGMTTFVDTRTIVPFPTGGNAMWGVDGLHMSASGYAQLGAGLAPAVKSLLEPTAAQ